MKLFSKLLLGSITAALCSFQGTFAQEGDAKALDIIKKVDYNSRGFGKYSADMTMFLNMPGGKSFKREMKVYSAEQPNDYERTINIFKSPADVKGTKLLIHAHAKITDDQWIFLPALNKPKRISNDNTSGSFMGSEVAFEDLGNAKMMKFSHKFIREDDLRGKNCYVIHSTPLSKYSGYSYVEMWVDKALNVMSEVRFFDKRKELMKIETPELKLFNNRTYMPVRITYKNVKTNKVTVITWDNYDFRQAINNNLFSPEKFDNIN